MLRRNSCVKNALLFGQVALRIHLTQKNNLEATCISTTVTTKSVVNAQNHFHAIQVDYLMRQLTVLFLSVNLVKKFTLIKPHIRSMSRENTLKFFKTHWDNIHKKFGTTYPLKIHIMLTHVNPFVEKIQGGLNKRGSDQVTEAAHQLLHHRMQKSNYFRRVVGTESEGEGLYRAVVHTNAYNI